MKRDPNELTNMLELVVKDITIRGLFTNTLNKAQSELSKYFAENRILQILQESAPIHTLSMSNWYNLSRFFVDHNLLDIKLEDYFTDEEMTYAINDKIEQKSFSKDKIVIENVLSNENKFAEEYIAVLDYITIAEMFEDGCFDYNFATQRKAKTIKIKGRTERIADVDMKNVNDMVDKMINGDFHSNAITLNIRVTGTEMFDFDGRNLTIDRHTTKIDEIDGYHRTVAIHKAWKINPRVEGKMYVMIKHLTVDGARSYIAQEAMGNYNNQKEMRLYNPEGVIAKMIYLINNNNRNGNILKGKISTGNNGDNILIFNDVFAKNLNLSWSELLEGADELDLREIADFICDFYNVTYSVIMRKYKTKSIEELKDTLALDMMFMCGFLYPAAKMYGKEKSVDVDTIKKMIEKIKFEDNNSKYTYESDDKWDFPPYEKAWRTII